MNTQLEPQLAALASRQGGVILRRQALDCGYSDQEIEQLLRDGLWVRIRRGAYIERAVWDVMDRVARHRATVNAVTLVLEKPAVVSHISACVMLNLPTWGYDLSLVHITRGDLHSPRIEGGVHHHAGAIADGDITVVDGIIVTPPDRTAVDVARLGGFERGVVVADATIRLLGGDRDALLRRMDQMRDWRGARAAGRVTEFADGRSESVGESRNRVLFELNGLPRPQLQVLIVDSTTGAVIARVDYFFEEEKTIGEFDGRLKYRAVPEDGLSAEDVVWREKRREDALRDQGYEVARSIWDDLRHPQLVVARYRRCFERAAKRRAVLV